MNVLLDLDGTLTDPKPGITRCIAHALERMGRTAPPLDELAWCIGPPLRGSFPLLLGEHAPDDVDLAVGWYRERFADVGLYENGVYAGVPEALAAMRDRGDRLFLATSKPIVFARRILDHFDLARFFDGTYGSELDGTRDAKADVIAHALASEGLDPRACVMVGDRVHDVDGAATHGVPAVGVLYGYGSREELSGARAFAVTPGEIPAAVSSAKIIR